MAKGLNQPAGILVRLVIPYIEKIRAMGALPSRALGCKALADAVADYDDLFG